MAPAITGGGLSSLADTLTLCFMTVPSLFRLQERIEHPILHLEVFFLEQIIDRYVGAPYRGASSGIPREEPGSEGHPQLNVSAELTVFEDHRFSSSVMSLEGVYSPADPSDSCATSTPTPTWHRTSPSSCSASRLSGTACRWSRASRRSWRGSPYTSPPTLPWAWRRLPDELPTTFSTRAGFVRASTRW